MEKIWGIRDSIPHASTSHPNRRHFDFGFFWHQKTQNSFSHALERNFLVHIFQLEYRKNNEHPIF